MPEPAGQARHGGAVDQRRPEELERIGQGREAEEGDQLQRQAGVPEPGRQGVEDQEVRQAGGKAQRQHGGRAPLEIDGRGGEEALADRFGGRIWR